MIKIVWNTGEEQIFPCSFDQIKTLSGFEESVIQYADRFVRLKYAREIIDMEHPYNKDD